MYIFLLLIVTNSVCVQMLLDYGAEVNSTFATLETTALMTSSFHGHAQIVRTLLDHGASAKAVDSQGSTALGYAFGGTVMHRVWNKRPTVFFRPVFCLLPSDAK